MHPTISKTSVTVKILIAVVVFMVLSPFDIDHIFPCDLFCISRLQIYNTISPEVSRWINITNPYSSVMFSYYTDSDQNTSLRPLQLLP